MIMKFAVGSLTLVYEKIKIFIFSCPYCSNCTTHVFSQRPVQNLVQQKSLYRLETKYKCTKKWDKAYFTQNRLKFLANSQHVGNDSHTPHVCGKRDKVVVHNFRGKELWSTKVHFQFFPWLIPRPWIKER